jgi:PAS domain S-box-containing protein
MKWKDLVLILFFAIILTSVSMLFDFHEQIHRLTRPLEPYDIDEFVLFLPFFLLAGMVWFSYRRAKEANHELTIRKQAEEALARRVTELNALNAMAAIVNESVNVDEILNRAMDEALRLVGVEASGMLLLDEEAGELALVAHRGLSDEFVRAFSRLKLGEGLAGQAAQTGKPVILERLEDYPQERKAYVEKERIQSAAGVPLIGSKGVIGAMKLAMHTPRYFDATVLQLLVGLGRQIAGGVEKARLYEREQEAVAATAAAKSAIDTIEAMGDGLILNTLDGKITFVNPAFEKMTGYEKDELVGRDLADLLQELVKPEDLGKTMEAVGTALEGKVPISTSHTLVSKNGREVPITFTVSFIRDTKGQPFSVIVAFNDITDLKRAETERKRLFNFSIDMLCIAGFDGSFKQLNPAWSKALGWTEEELMSKAWLEFVHPEDRQTTISVGEQLISGKPVLSFENRYLCKDGSYLWISWNSFPLPEEELIFAVARDITERKRAEEIMKRQTRELARSNAELGQFAYVASHDLQEPLRIITSYLQLLERRYKESLDSEGEKFIARAVDSAGRMRTLINDLLAYCRVGTQGKPFESTNCESTIGDILADLEVAVKESGAVVTLDPLPTVWADPMQLTQLFQNLLSNAIKFRGDDPPRIHISAEAIEKSTILHPVESPTGGPPKAEFHRGTPQSLPSGLEALWAGSGGVSRSGPEAAIEKGWLFSVSDNGIGIEPEYANRIFGVFQRLHTRSKYPGTGIGLAICQKVVQRHGGEIWVDSEPGKGSMFYFTIPDKGGFQE